MYVVRLWIFDLNLTPSKSIDLKMAGKCFVRGHLCTSVVMVLDIQLVLLTPHPLDVDKQNCQLQL